MNLIEGPSRFTPSEIFHNNPYRMIYNLLLQVDSDEYPAIKLSYMEAMEALKNLIIVDKKNPENTFIGLCDREKKEIAYRISVFLNNYRTYSVDELFLMREIIELLS